MNFFEHQDRARASTTRLIILFIFAVIFLVVLTCALVGAVAYLSKFPALDWSRAWPMYAWTASATLLMIGGMSFAKWYVLRLDGGISLALDLGGQMLDTQLKDPKEIQLRNVVEEMAIASGVPVPEIFVFEEPGLNAFAAGHTSRDAVIGITRGCLNALTRDELQGVIAHEFSHIFNGDMKLNMKIIGVLNGILFFTVIGRILLRAGGSGGTSSRRSGKGAWQLALVGLALILIGWVGVLLGRLIQAAVSRQREFLADASAVQFTRNPLGIAGALKKIALASEGSRIDNPNAESMSHFFISSPKLVRASSWSSPFASHPPLFERIKRIDPSFRPEDIEKPLPTDRTPILHSISASPFNADEFIKSFGKPNASHVEAARNFIEALPRFVRFQAGEPVDARAVVLALFLQPDDQQRRYQIEFLKSQYDAALIPNIERVFLELKPLGRSARLPVLELAIPSVKKLARMHRQSLAEAVKTLISSDQKIELFEFSLMKILLSQLQLEPIRDLKKRISADQFRRAVEVFFSALARANGESEEAQQIHFKKMIEFLDESGLRFLPLKECGPREIHLALRDLSYANYSDKGRVMISASKVIYAIPSVSTDQIELLRAFACSLDIPSPITLKPAA